MSYEQLSQHAADIERSAIEESLKRRGYIKGSDGDWRGGGTDEASVQAAVDVTVARYRGVAELFTPFLGMPDPDAFTPMIDGLKAALRTLAPEGRTETDFSYRLNVTANPDLLGMTTVGKALQEWRGTAAVAFRQHFIEPFPAITANQFTLVVILRAPSRRNRLYGRQPARALTTSPTRPRPRST